MTIQHVVTVLVFLYMLGYILYLQVERRVLYERLEKEIHENNLIEEENAKQLEIINTLSLK